MSKNLHMHLPPIFLLSFLLSLLFMSLNYASVSLPANILYYLPITFTNQQSTAVAANTQLMIPFNALAYQSYETNTLNNTEFFYANGTIMPSWIEGNVLNENSNALSTATNVIIWVKSPDTNTFLPANTGTATTNTVYMGFAGTGATTQNMLLSNTITGEAPQLSPSYAEYDDGASVFLSYFNGDTPPSGFTVTSGFTLSQATEVAMPNGNTGNVIYVTGYNSSSPQLNIPFVYNNGYTLQPSIIESSAELHGDTPTAQGIAGVLTNTAITSANGIGVTMGWDSSYFSQEYESSGSVTTDLNQQGSAVTTWIYVILSTFSKANWR